MKTLSLSRVGAICVIGGAAVTGIFNGMHPDLADPAGIVQNAAGSSKWIAVHWGLIIGMVLMQLGFSIFVQTLRHPMENHEAGEWGLLGVYMLMVGLVLWICVFAAEVGLKPLADAAKTDQVRQGGALALSSFVDATATAATIVYWLGVRPARYRIVVFGALPTLGGRQRVGCRRCHDLGRWLSKGFFRSKRLDRTLRFSSLGNFVLGVDGHLGRAALAQLGRTCCPFGQQVACKSPRFARTDARTQIVRRFSS